MKQQELRDHVLAKLNAILATDRDALTALVEVTVPCSEEVIKDGVQVRDTPEGTRMGLLGVINALVGIIEEEGPRNGWGHVTAVVEDDGSISSFQSILDWHSNPQPKGNVP